MKILARALCVIFLFAGAYKGLKASSLFLIYRDFDHSGDRNQAQGVIGAYKSLVPNVEIHEFNRGQEDQLCTLAQSHLAKKPIILAVGEKIIHSFNQRLPLKGTTTIHLCHMITLEHKTLLEKIDFVAVPKHTITPLFADIFKEMSGKVIKTRGVAHNKKAAEIDRIYSNNKELLPYHHSYLGIILGGDAPTSENNILLFTVTQAKELAQYVLRTRHDRHLLISNGPRTGKYDPLTFQENKTAHRTGKKDFITQIFIDELLKGGVLITHFTLFDFQFNAQSDQTMDTLLGAIKATSLEILIPGESISLISECVDTLPLKSIIVYETSSMNEGHKMYVQSEFKQGHLQTLTRDLQELPKSFTVKENESKVTAAEKIALQLFRFSNLQ